MKQVVSGLANFGFIYVMAALNLRATLVTFIIPLIVMCIGLMVGNWGQHAFVDEEDPDSNFRSSITLIDVPVSLAGAPFITYSNMPSPTE